MKIDIRQIQPEGSDFHYSGTAEDMEISIEGVKFPSPVEADIAATLSGDEIICQGEIYASVEIECSRCLEIFDFPITARLQFVVQMLDTTLDVSSDDADDDYEVIPKTQSVCDVSQRIRDAIVLNIPLKPLCDEDCRGLCPMCGINLNEDDCDCTPDKADERWEALKDLFNEELE